MLPLPAAAPRPAGKPWQWPAVPVLVCSMLLAALVASAGAAHGAPFGVDEALHRWVLEHRPRRAVEWAVAVTVTGSGVPAYLLAMLAGAMTVRAHRWRGALVGALALGSVQLPRIALASWLARPRPPVAEWAWSADGYAMPSGHTTTSVAVAVLLTAGVHRVVRGPARRTLLVIPALWAAAVGASRVYLGMHWPTDVLAGWLLTAQWAGVLGMFLTLLRRRKSGAVPSNEGEGT
ncbi:MULTISPECIES: phosphatase PAP2 family protein [unclassified Streptomyces]|uniref:phosphatase PAP2 family protein n=1 Tax=unclassified Streptomyces TaxID=2593676 RepID=UPI002E296E52|nr:phosphatase PAP2 family protein [Streptomyces sp. NBC_01439]